MVRKLDNKAARTSGNAPIEEKKIESARQNELNETVRGETLTPVELGATRGDLEALLCALDAARVGDFSIRLPNHRSGLTGKIADAFNDIVASNERMAQQLERVGKVVGRDGQTSTRVRFGNVNGSWGEMETSVNTLVDDLLWPMTSVTHTITSVAKGDLLQTVPLNVDGRPLKGEFLQSATIVNTMIQQLG
ncbi:MAG: hybrid sensor histidine kinase/response regulator, partial [Hyphomicrobiales bacterium]|nr:hybrid sensor histidine kinase/response regulator [Hyphomicrobiales bacterium]